MLKRQACAKFQSQIFDESEVIQSSALAFLPSVEYSGLRAKIKEYLGLKGGGGYTSILVCI